MTGVPQDNSPADPRLRLMRETVTLLSELLQTLYPELPSADVITLDDFLRRYQLTGLGAPAVQAIEQTQRINRALSNYRQMGLSEFHIGLFYLHWGECQGSIKQFARARLQWSFIDEITSVCLAYFAEGSVHHLVYEHEVAMDRYLRAEQWLPRTTYSVPTQNQDEFVRRLSEYLPEAQARLRDDMLRYFQAGQSPTAAAEERPPANGAATEAQEDATGPVPEAAPAPSVAAVPRPISNLDADPNQPSSPVPAHMKVNDNYVWYEVSTEDENFLPDVVRGSMVLVNTNTLNHEFKQDELIVVLRSRDTDGSIVLKPRTSDRPFQRITFLASSRFEGSFTRAMATGKVALSSNSEQPVNLEEILGIVVGFWLPWPKPAAHL